MFRRRIVVVVVVGEHAKKNSFHTRKKCRFSMTTSVRSRLAYPVVVVEDGLGEHAKKKLFSHKKKISLLDDNKG
jgi:hypothetical protein